MEKETEKHKAFPQELPKPTWYPLVLSMGVALIFWGIVTQYVMSLIGLGLFFYGLVGWINDLRDEYNESGNE
ncbi:hypothetical protein FUAX_48530 (plasmid) [Fulvitalea axinellae]|uniref:Cytochrome c oxidase polypeptide IV n=1 Tax=Fulvitalea axinellae TaxID=1182444 RepID=A0AAU9CTP1_9BACT|nr:hypothetical protein FUAX_48530 [Fulvitalea axinellae]